MSNPMTKGSNFDPQLVTEMFNKVRGKSALAALCGASPVPFTGEKVFTFSFDSDVDIVGENGEKGHGGITTTPITITPVKFEYGARVTDEFLRASESVQLDILRNFSDGFARKVAAGIDKAAMHGLNPRSGAASTVVGTNHFDNKVTQTVTYAAATADAKLDDAIDLVTGAGFDVTGIAMSGKMRSDIAKLTANGARKYPDFAFGGAPKALGGAVLAVNSTVNAHAASAQEDMAIVGDFENAFRWGFSDQIPVTLIQYGDPDNTGVDLAGHNQVYLRAEAYVGWGILSGASFATVKV